MQPIKVIPVTEFLQQLKDNGLVIGRAEDFVADRNFDLQVKRANLKKQKAATLKEILDAKIINQTSKRTINRWIENGKIHEGEWYKCAKTNRVMVLTSALVRLGYL